MTAERMTADEMNESILNSGFRAYDSMDVDSGLVGIWGTFPDYLACQGLRNALVVMTAEDYSHSLAAFQIHWIRICEGTASDAPSLSVSLDETTAAERIASSIMAEATLDRGRSFFDSHNRASIERVMADHMVSLGYLTSKVERIHVPAFECFSKVPAHNDTRITYTATDRGRANWIGRKALTY